MSLADFFRTLAALFRRAPAYRPPVPSDSAPAIHDSGLVTPALLRALGTDDPAGWAAVLVPACARFKIDTKQRAAMFLANVIHESGGFRSLTESLNYSVIALAQNFGRHRISTEDAQRLGRKVGQMGLSPGQQAELANVLYGGEWGRKNLGNMMADDGWRYRGRGAIQITGRANYSQCGMALNLPLHATPELLSEPRHAAMSAAWFWAVRAGCNALADAGDVAEARRKINGGENGLAEVAAMYHQALAALG